MIEMMKPNKREYREVIVLLNEAMRRVEGLGHFDGYFEEGYIDIHYFIGSAVDTLRESMNDAPIYLPLTILLGIEQDYIEEIRMWSYFQVAQHRR